MVYIHGGAFLRGDSSRRAWGPDYFMEENVLHVSIGHRLGLFGELVLNIRSQITFKPKTTRFVAMLFSFRYCCFTNVTCIIESYISGFLNFADPSLDVPGNAGLKDIIMALRWIKANALNFNGVPDRITIFGHSSGSALVNMLLASPQTEGLFHKAILLAGFSAAIGVPFGEEFGLRGK